MGRDSNPRDDSSPSTHFPGVRLQPLGHPSTAAPLGIVRGRRQGAETSGGEGQTQLAGPMLQYGELERERGRLVMVVGRIIGWIFLLIGLFVLSRDLILLGIGYDLFAWLNTRHAAPIVLGELWYAINPASLQLLQPAIQRHIHPALWDWVVQPMLLWWAWPVFTVLGSALLLLCRRRGDRPRRRRR
jgi:hypothetical protein